MERGESGPYFSRFSIVPGTNGFGKCAASFFFSTEH